MTESKKVNKTAIFLASKEAMKKNKIVNSKELAIVLHNMYKELGVDKYSTVLVMESYCKTNGDDENFNKQAFTHVFSTINSDMSIQTHENIIKDYMVLFDEFVESDPISNKFKMDEEDVIGWQIFRELTAKVELMKDKLTIKKLRKAHHENTFRDNNED